MRTLLLILRVAAVLIGAAHAGISIRDHMMNEDGIQYLDLGDAYAQGDWSHVNSVWSPLYPFILGLAVRFAEPGPRWEFAVAHLVTLGIYILALCCFEFFWRTTWRALRAGSRADEPAQVTLPAWAWWLSGYALFVWSSVVLIRFRAVSPDMLVAALVYLAAGCLVRTASPSASGKDHALLGMTLGLGYLAKAVMFPLALVFLGAAGYLDRSPGKLRRWLVGTATFALVAIPLVLALSVQKGRLTFGEAGQFTYLKHVNDMPYPHRADEIPAGLGTPVHPTRLVHESPDVYEFASPVPGTYPVGLDPSYWAEGVSPRFEWRQQLRVFTGNAAYYAELFCWQLGGPLALTLLLLWLGPDTLRRGFAWRWPLALIAVASTALGVYALVYVDGRYLAPFVLMLLAGLITLVRLPDTTLSWRAVVTAGILIPVFLLIELSAFDAKYVPRRLTPGAIAWDTRAAFRRPDAPWRIAEAMHEVGIQPGDRIGFIGYAYGATFARLAQVQITAEMSWEEARKFWKQEPEARDEVLKTFSRAGAVAVVSEVPPPKSWGWIELSRSGRYAILMEHDR